MAKNSNTLPQSITEKKITKVSAEAAGRFQDILAVEEPLEIRIGFGKMPRRSNRSLAVTMRSPGNDFELATGFLYTEGIISSASDVLSVRYTGEELSQGSQTNVVLIDLHPEVPVDWEQVERHFYTTSSCGVCGKASIDMLRATVSYFPRAGFPRVERKTLFQLPKRLHRAQTNFHSTGGIHAAGIFDAEGRLELIREDVGRHNALDKLIGRALQKGLLPLTDRILLVSGRASFELVQKALIAGIPFLAAVGAPSSLAVELADEYGMSLTGFLRNGKFNVYCGAERVILQ